MRRFLYRSLWWFTGMQLWLRRRLTPAGWLALSLVCAGAVVGVDTQQTVAYQIFTFMLALLVLAMLSVFTFRARFEIRRSLPPFVTAGETFSYRSTISNIGIGVKSGLTLLEELADPRPDYRSFQTLEDPDSQTHNRLDQALGYHRWKAVLDRNTNAEVAPLPLPDLHPGIDVEVIQQTCAQHRGYVRFEGVNIARTDPAGLFRAFAKVPARQYLLVLPKRYVLPEISLPGNRTYQHGGVTLATSVGDSEEFIGLRDYRPGDPLQTVHWKSFARTGKPMVREYQDEFFERHALILDTFASAGQHQRLEEAVAIAASFVCTLETQECLLDLMFVSKKAYTYTAGRGQMHTEDMLEVLAGVRQPAYQQFDELHDVVLQHRGSLSSSIVILLDWDESRRKLIDDLQGSGLPLRVLLITDPGHVYSDLPASVLRLETGDIQAGLAAL